MVYRSMVDVLLIQPPIRDFYLTTKRTIPYGLACIASVLIQDGFSVAILDALATHKSRAVNFPEEMAYLKDYYGNSDSSPFALFHQFKHFGTGFEAIGEAASRSGAFLVGIASLFTAYGAEAITTAEVVKRYHPGCRIVLGGHHPTAMPESVMESSAVDYAIRGEGEGAMPALARALRSSAEVGSVPGIVRRRPDGTIQVSEPAVTQILDEHPGPASQLLEHAFYRRRRQGTAVVVASRGCPMSCSYCSVGASSPLGYRRRSVESVLREIEAGVLGHAVGLVDFEDENISLGRTWFLELLNGIRERFSSHELELRAMNGLLPNTLDEEVIRAMQAAGFRTLNLSLGSTSEAQLRHFRRPNVTAAFDQVLHLAEKYHLQAVGYLIAGAPGQDPDASLADLLHLASRRVLVGLSIYYPAPGSSDFEKCVQKNLLPPQLSLWRSSAIPISDTTTREESITLLRLARLLNFMKLLADREIGLPQAAPFAAGDFRGAGDRIETGLMLLKWFLHDGRIRGVTRAGELYEHRISQRLGSRFLDELKGIPIRGANGWPNP
jgi:anaerobic magnesium-protoporphyrin IX monomethyl ester cyclase